MPQLILGNLTSCCELIRVHGSSDWRAISIQGLADDSRKVSPGDLFFAIKGGKLDGMAYVGQAVSKGALAIVAEDSDDTWKSLNSDSAAVPVLLVKDVRLAAAQLAARFYGDISAEIPCLAVTGTNGKTSIAWLMAALLGEERGGAALVGTLGFALAQAGVELKIADFIQTGNTTPDPLDIHAFLADARSRGANGLVAEATSQAIVQRRVESIHWDSAVFTNLTRDHLDLHGTLENYGTIKTKLFTELLKKSSKQRKTAILNLDDKLGADILELVKGGDGETKAYSFSCDSDRADAFVVEAKTSLTGSRIVAKIFGEEVELKTKLIGHYNISNVLAAVTCLASIGYPLSLIAERLPSIPCVPGRLELVAPADIPVFVDYAHTPDGLVNVQQSLRELKPRRLITVFGCGGDRDRGKRPLMGQAVAELSDYAVVTSDNPRSEEPESIIEDILPGVRKVPGFAYEAIPKRDEAIDRAIALAQPGDAVLVAGKGHEDYQEIKGVKHPFLDRDVCLGVMARRGIV